MESDVGIIHWGSLEYSVLNVRGCLIQEHIKTGINLYEYPVQSQLLDVLSDISKTFIYKCANAMLSILTRHLEQAVQSILSLVWEFPKRINISNSAC